jgi:hypothetical protein
MDKPIIDRLGKQILLWVLVLVAAVMASRLLVVNPFSSVVLIVMAAVIGYVACNLPADVVVEDSSTNL